jgi:sugar phosphate isomerase/epimerase
MAFTVKIGVDQFSYHRFFGEISPWEADPGLRWTIADFLNRVSSMGVDAVGLQTAYLNSVNLEVLRRELTERSLICILEWGHPDGLKMGKSQWARSDLKRWIRKCAQMRVRTLRIVAGYPTYRGQEPVSVQIERLTPLLREMCVQAAEFGVVLALENHADFTPAELTDLIHRVHHPNLRALFDTGNTIRVGACLIESAAHIASITEIVHLKDLYILKESLGNPNASWPSAPLGRGSLDIPGVLATLRQHGFNGILLIEMAHMHPNWPDEDDAVAQSVEWLRNRLGSCSPGGES